MSFGGTISNNFLQTAGSFTLSGNATITGGVTVNGGTINFLGNRFTAGSMMFVPKHRLHGSVVTAGHCSYHQPVITPELDARFGGPGVSKVVPDERRLQ